MMPTDNSGVYSLPGGYLAVTGENIEASQHNPPLEDIATALTNRLPRNGAAPMTGPLKLTDGTVGSPALQFANAPTNGIYATASGWAVAILGVKVAEFTSSGLLGATPVGAGMDYWGPTAPSGWIFPYGQAVSRTTYAALFAALGTTHGIGDGSTTFNLPDKRSRLSFPKDDMGGSAAARVTTAGGGIDGATLGASGGAQNRTIAKANLPDLTLATSIADPGHSHSASASIQGGLSGVPSGGGAQLGGSTAITVDAATTGITASTHLDGSGVALQTLPPSIVCNYIIFAGVAS